MLKGQGYAHLPMNRISMMDPKALRHMNPKISDYFTPVTLNNLSYAKVTTSHLNPIVGLTFPCLHSTEAVLSWLFLIWNLADLVLMDAATVFIYLSSSSSSLFHCIFKIRLIPTRTIQQYMSQHFWFQQMRCILTIQPYCHHPWCCESNNIDLTSAHNTLNHSIKENPTISIACPFLMNAYSIVYSKFVPFQDPLVSNIWFSTTESSKFATSF